MTCPPPAPPPSLSTAKRLSSLGRRPALDDPRSLPEASSPTLAEVFPATATDGAGPGFVAAHLTGTAPRPVLWVQDRMSLREAGRPYLAGFPDPPELLCLVVSRAVDVLWALEQGLGCSGLSAVVGEVWGNPPVLDFTATKRLALRAEAHGCPAWLIRRGAEADLSAARERWRIGSLPSLSEPDDTRAPGAPQWRAELFRARWRPPGDWVVRHEAGKLVYEHGVARPATEEPARPARQMAG